jgi:uncharacterized cupredoxin-like copper-binding protein
MALRRLALIAVPLALVAAACGGDGSDADVTVTLHDDGIELSTSSAAAGDLTFEGVNAGSMTHEFEVFVVPEGVDADDLPMDGDVATADETLEVVDEIEDIAPGTSATLNLNLDAGTYAVICNLPGHYANGMHTTFAVA